MLGHLVLDPANDSRLYRFPPFPASIRRFDSHCLSSNNVTVLMNEMNDTPRSLVCVLVVGGCGFLGSCIVHHLQEHQHTSSLAVIDINTSRNQLPNVSYHELDISCKEDVSSIFRQLRPDIVFHTATPKPFSSPEYLFEKINVGGTRNLLEAAKDVGCVKAFIYTSSSGVIHDSVSDIFELDETAPVLYMPVQKSVYAHSKAVAEDLVLKANRESANGGGGGGKVTMLTTALRPSGLFGEDDQGTVKPLVDAAASGSFRFQLGDGKNLFDWTYVVNAVQAHIRAAYVLMEHHSKSPSDIPSDRRVDGEAFLITNGEHMAFWEFARAIGAAAGYPTNEKDVYSVPISVGLALAAVAEWIVWLFSLGRKRSKMSVWSMRYSTLNRTFRIDKAKSRLGYKPEVSVAEGITRAGESFSKDK